MKQISNTSFVMNRFLLATALLCSFLLYGGHVDAQTLLIRSGGMDQQAAVSSVQKLTFTGADMKLSYKEGVSVDYPLASISKMWFETGTSDVQEELALPSEAPSLYPNPAADYVEISGAAEGEYQILQVDGKMMKKGYFTPGQPLDVTGLQPGLYLLQLQGITLKLSKQ